MNKNPIKCSVCGKFISYFEIDTDQIRSKFTPDSEHTTEKTEFWHLKCAKKKVLTK